MEWIWNFLQSISLTVSQVRTVETVLKRIVFGLASRAAFALDRIGLMSAGDTCAPCAMGTVRRELSASGRECRAFASGYTGVEPVRRLLPPHSARREGHEICEKYKDVATASLIENLHRPGGTPEMVPCRDLRQSLRRRRARVRP